MADPTAGDGLELLPALKSCYFCGTHNPLGPRIRYAYDPQNECVTGRADLDRAYCGYPGVVHGGIQSALLDDVMYWAVTYRTTTSSVTLELSCRYRKTARLGEPLVLRARCGAREGRKAEAAGELLDERGEVLAEATALYLLHPREEFLATLFPEFDFEGCTAAMRRRFSERGSPAP
jgi:acyl-coenzyme A thioesterase PaaI-like protein